MSPKFPRARPWSMWSLHKERIRYVIVQLEILRCLYSPLSERVAIWLCWLGSPALGNQGFQTVLWGIDCCSQWFVLTAANQLGLSYYGSRLWLTLAKHWTHAMRLVVTVIREISAYWCRELWLTKLSRLWVLAAADVSATDNGLGIGCLMASLLDMRLLVSGSLVLASLLHPRYIAALYSSKRKITLKSLFSLFMWFTI